MPRPAALRLHHQRQDERQGPRHDEDDAERVIGHERQIDVQRKEQDRANHDQDDADSDTHVFLLCVYPPESGGQLAFLADFVVAVFLAGVFFDDAFLAGAFLADIFLAGPFRAAAFLAVGLVSVPFLVTRFCSTLRRSASIRSTTSPRSASSSSCSPKVAAVSSASPFSSFAAISCRS